MQGIRSLTPYSYTLSCQANYDAADWAQSAQVAQSSSKKRSIGTASLRESLDDLKVN